MNHINSRRKRLRLILSRAHQVRQAGPPLPGPDWRRRVMNSLPGLETKLARMEQWAFMERLVWRLVPAAGALALFMVILVSQVGPDPNMELASLISSDYADSSLYSFYQGEYAHD